MLIYFVQVSVLLLIVVKMSFIITLFAMAVYGALTVVGAINSNRLYNLAKEQAKKTKDLSNDLSGLQQNKKFFKTSLLNNKMITGIFSHIEGLTSNVKKHNLIAEMQRAMSLIITFGFLLSLMFFYKQLSLSQSVLLLILMVFLRIAPQFAALVASYSTLDTSIPMHQSLHERLESLRKNRESNGADSYKSYGKISVKDLSFSYPDGYKGF